MTGNRSPDSQSRFLHLLPVAVLSWAGLILLLSWNPALAQTAAAASTRPAVLLHRPELKTPLGAAGSGVEPEVKIRAEVDETGRVAAVEVLSILPASELDETFREAAVTSIGEWRFAPALDSGRGVATTVTLTLKYRAAGGRGKAASFDALFSPSSGPHVPAPELERLPRQQRGVWLNRYARVASRHMTGARMKRAESPRFIVVTDVENPATAEIVAGNLESIFNTLHGLFDRHLEPLSEPYKLVAFLFASRASFAAVMSELAPELDSTAGVYLPPGFLAFHQEVPTGQQLLAVMIHESVHAFSGSHFRQPGASPPLWLEEGLAEYFANSRIEKGALVPGRAEKARIIIRHGGGAMRLKTDAGWTLEDIKRAIRRNEAPSLTELLGMTRLDFYESRQSYGLSWLFVHFLRHGEADWAEHEFPTLLLYIVEGYPAEAAILHVYGRSISELEPLFRDYVLRF